MRRRHKQCSTCPFRGADEAYRKECAVMDAEDWPCHSEDIHGNTDIQCRGHYEARRKYPPSDEDVAELQRWREANKDELMITF